MKLPGFIQIGKCMIVNNEKYDSIEVIIDKIYNDLICTVVETDDACLDDYCYCLYFEPDEYGDTWTAFEVV